MFGKVDQSLKRLTLPSPTQKSVFSLAGMMYPGLIFMNTINGIIQYSRDILFSSYDCFQT
jgi:hypothetical protein